jgi:SAM-dependent methyltransferase
MDTREEAVTYPRGDIDLRHCPRCGFIFNAAFDASLHQYSERYEETQGFSPTFRTFHRRLAERLIERWDVRGKRILEIGCGKGEFLALLCELGDNSGVGFDPAFVPDRRPEAGDVELRFYSETYPPQSEAARVEPPPDFVCCKMTLEHIADVRTFVGQVRGALRAGSDSVVFFQVPDAGRVFREGAFWDVYYEHCSYFTSDSLVRLFEACGFEVVEAWTEYDAQYLMIAAVASAGASGGSTEAGDGSGYPDAEGADDAPVGRHGGVADLAPLLRAFAERVTGEVAWWRDRIETEIRGGGTVCLWGGGSKAVSFLSAIDCDLVAFAVDINPHKAGTYLPGSGVEVLAPDDLARRAPTLVIAMNPVYLDEIGADIRARGLSADLVALG